MVQGGDGIGVQHVALSAGRGAFDLLNGALGGERIQPPMARRRGPVQRSIPDGGREVPLFARIGNRQETLQRPLRKRGVQSRAGGQVILLQVDPRRGVSGRDARPAHWPARARRQVHAEAEASGFERRVGEFLHPARREKANESILVPFHAIHRADLDAADARVVKRGEHTRQVGVIHRAAQPPPARPGTGVARRRPPARFGLQPAIILRRRGNSLRECGRRKGQGGEEAKAGSHFKPRRATPARPGACNGRSFSPIANVRRTRRPAVSHSARRIFSRRRGSGRGARSAHAKTRA